MRESQIQRAVCNHFKARGAPGCVMFAVPNGGYRNPFEAKNLKEQGVVRGIPDLVFVMGRRIYFLELKAAKGRVSKAQLDCMQALKVAGATCFVAWGLSEAIQALEHWGILQGNMSYPTTLSPCRRGQTAASANAGGPSLSLDKVS